MPDNCPLLLVTERPKEDPNLPDLIICGSETHSSNVKSWWKRIFPKGGDTETLTRA